MNQSEATRKEAEEKQQQENDPIFQAMQLHKLSIGMTLEQANKSLRLQGVQSEVIGSEQQYTWRIYGGVPLADPAAGMQTVYLYTMWATFTDGKITAFGRD